MIKRQPFLLLLMCIISFTTKSFSIDVYDFKNDVIDIRAEELEPILFNKLKDLIQYQNYDQNWFQDYFSQNYSSQNAEALELYLGELETMLRFWKKILSQVNK